MLINAIDDELVEKIRSLKFDPDAKPFCCEIPLGGILWPDEFPEETSVIFDGSEKSRDAFLSIFAIRMKYWDEGKFEREDLKVLNEAKSLFPDWPFFRRLKLTKEELQFQRECEESTLQLIDSFAKNADEFKIEEK